MNRIALLGDVRNSRYSKVVRVQLPYASDGSELKFYQGDMIVADVLADNARFIFKGELVTAPTTQKAAIIINQDVYKDEFGNKTGVTANPGNNTYKSGEVVTVYRPDDDNILVIANEAINGTPVKGKYLVAPTGANTENRLVPANDATGYKVYYEVLNAADTTSIKVGYNSVAASVVRTVVD